MDPTNLLYLEGRSDNSTHLKDGGIALAMVGVKRGIVHLPTAFPILSDKDFDEAFVKIFVNDKCNEAEAYFILAGGRVVAEVLHICSTSMPSDNLKKSIDNLIWSLFLISFINVTIITEYDSSLHLSYFLQLLRQLWRGQSSWMRIRMNFTADLTSKF